MILVTGATGNIGRSVLDHLVRHGVAARALVRDPSRLNADSGTVQIVYGDLTDPDTLAGPLDGIERLFLVMAHGPRMVELQTNMVRAAANAGVRHIVHSTGAGVGALDSITHRWHGEVEQAVRESGIPFTTLRPSSFMQNLFANARSIAEGGAIYAPLGDSKVTWIDAGDIGAAAAAALTSDGRADRVYELTGSEQLTMAETAEVLSDALNKPVRYQPVSLRQAREQLDRAGMDPDTADALVELWTIMADGWYPPLTDGVERLTHHHPTPLAAFAAENADRFRAQSS